MDKRGIFKICIYLFLFFVAMAVLEITIRGISKGISNFAQNIQEEKKQEEIYNSESEIAKRNVKEFVEKVLKALADEDYDYVTHCLDRRYLLYFFNNDKEKVKASLSDFLESNSNYQITDISSKEQGYHVYIGFTSGDKFYTKYVTVFGTNVENYGIMFGYYDYIVSSDYCKKVNDLSFDNNFNYSSNGEIVYPIDIINSSGEQVEIEFTRKYLVGISGTQIECDGTDKIIIEPNGKQRIELSSTNIKEDILYLNLEMKINGVEEKVEMYSDNDPIT